MALPVTKQELADWILRRLGAPVVNVEITDEQLEDVIDEAVQFFQWYHYDGAERTYRVLKLSNECLAGQQRRHQELCASGGYQRGRGHGLQRVPRGCGRLRVRGRRAHE